MATIWTSWSLKFKLSTSKTFRRRTNEMWSQKIGLNQSLQQIQTEVTLKLGKCSSLYSLFKENYSIGFYWSQNILASNSKHFHLLIVHGSYSYLTINPPSDENYLIDQKKIDI